MPFPNPKIGPAWLVFQELTAAGVPTGLITNTGLNQKVTAKFKPKEYDIPAANSPTRTAGSISLGLETCDISGDLVQISADLFRIALTQGSDSVVGGTVNITGYGEKPHFKVMAIFPNLKTSGDIFAKIAGAIPAGTFECDIFEIRYAKAKANDVTREGGEKESILPLTFGGDTNYDVTIIPAKMKENVTIVPTVLKLVNPAAFPAELY